MGESESFNFGTDGVKFVGGVIEERFGAESGTNVSDASHPMCDSFHVGDAKTASRDGRSAETDARRTEGGAFVGRNRVGVEV